MAGHNYWNTTGPCSGDRARLMREAVRRLLVLLAGEDHVRIILFLSSIEGSASLRRSSRNTGLSYRLLARRLEELERAGLVAVSYERRNLRLYSATRLCRALGDTASQGG